MDHNLLGVFIERWRWETHTLHLQVGEMILILRDITVLFVLPINRQTFTVMGIQNKITLYEHVSGRATPLEIFKRNTLYMRQLYDNFSELLFILIMRSYDGILIWHNSAIYISIDLVWILSPYSITQVCQAYIFHRFGNILSMDLSGTHVPLFYLPPMEKFNSIQLYSWGSGIISYLYRYLCKVSLAKTKQVGGCLFFLQVKQYTKFFVFIFSSNIWVSY